jgi:hypothetical protein
MSLIGVDRTKHPLREYHGRGQAKGENGSGFQPGRRTLVSRGISIPFCTNPSTPRATSSATSRRSAPVVAELPGHLVAKMDDHDLWMAFFADPDGHMLAAMQDPPKGYAPASA